METYKGDAFILSHNIVYHESFTAGADVMLAERIVALLLNAGKRALIDESIVDEEPLTDGLKLVGLQIDDKTYYVFPLEVREEMYFGVMTCVHEILDRLNEIHYGEPDEIQQPKKQDLERAAGISHYTMNKLYHGENVTTDILVKICTVLNVSMDEILEIIPKEN